MTESLFLAAALSVDSFAAGLSCGAGRVKIPLLSALIISGVGAGFLTLSLLLGGAAGGLIPQSLCKILSAGILGILGIISLFGSGLKACLRRQRGKRRLHFRWSGVEFMISLCLDEVEQSKADVDHSQTLSVREALLLSCALSMDSLATGFSFGLSVAQPVLTAALVFVTGLAAVGMGCRTGRLLNREKNHSCKTALAAEQNGAVFSILPQLSEKPKKIRDFSWVSGIVLLLLAALKLFP